MARGCTVIYGKITISSEVDKLEDVIHQLHSLVEKMGYPESKKMDDSMEEAEAALKEELGKGDEDEEDGGEDSVQSGKSGIIPGKVLQKLPRQI
jgi:hypothetical protein